MLPSNYSHLLGLAVSTKADHLSDAPGSQASIGAALYPISASDMEASMGREPPAGGDRGGWRGGVVKGTLGGHRRHQQVGALHITGVRKATGCCPIEGKTYNL